MNQDIHILFVDDEKFILRSLERLLLKERFYRHYAENGVDACAIMADQCIHILVMDMRMPGIDGISLLERIKHDHPDTVRLVLSAHTNTNQLLRCINSGEIFRFITKPIDSNELKKTLYDAMEYYMMRKDRIELVDALKQQNGTLENALKRQRALEKQLRQMAVTDALTGLYNRHYMDIFLDQEFKKCKRYKYSLCCLIMDMDHFKQVNDTYGHGFGDFALKEFSFRLKCAVRDLDLLFRFGGEEFVALLLNCSLEDGQVVAERILNACRDMPYVCQGQSASITVSIGMACFDTDFPKTATDMLEITDKRLYQAKTGGRNRCVCS